MKIFISYCDDGEGLGYAKRAKTLCKNRNIEAWVWHDNSNSAKWLDTDIVENLDSSNAVLTIVTLGTENSEPQKKEWSHASSFGKGNSSLRKTGLGVPKELSAKYCPEFDDDSFEVTCEKVINDIELNMRSVSMVDQIQGKETSKAYQIHTIAKQLDKHPEGLDEKVIEEFNKSVWEGYLGSTMVCDIVNLGELYEESTEKLVHIGIRSSIDLEKFNAKNYWWGPFFRDIGREIASGEKRLLIKGLQKEIPESHKPCNETKDELSAVLEEIERLKAAGHTPNVIIAPPSILKSFVHFFRDEKGKIIFEREHRSAATLDLKDIGRLDIYLPGGGMLPESVMLLNRSSVIWKVVPNPDTGYSLTTSIGRGLYPDKVAFVVGTTVRYEVVNKDRIARIPISR